VGKRESVQALAEQLKIDASAILHVLDVRERKVDPKSFDVNDLFARYLTTVEQVTEAVDAAPGADAPAGS
jgi:hypothetical protein